MMLMVVFPGVQGLLPASIQRNDPTISPTVIAAGGIGNSAA
jgi:hypothetical protein